MTPSLPYNLITRFFKGLNGQVVRGIRVCDFPSVSAGSDNYNCSQLLPQIRGNGNNPGITAFQPGPADHDQGKMCIRDRSIDRVKALQFLLFQQGL